MKINIFCDFDVIRSESDLRSLQFEVLSLVLSERKQSVSVWLSQYFLDFGLFQIGGDESVDQVRSGMD